MFISLIIPICFEIDLLTLLQDMPACTSLEEVVKNVKPTALIGAAAQPKTFTKEIIEEMTRNNDRPVSFRCYVGGFLENIFPSDSGRQSGRGGYSN